MTYPVMKTGYRPVMTHALLNEGIIHEPNKHEYAPHEIWAAFGGVCEDGLRICASIEYIPASAYPIWQVQIATSRMFEIAQIATRELVSYAHALAFLQEMLAKFKVEPGTPRLLN